MKYINQGRASAFIQNILYKPMRTGFRGRAGEEQNNGNQQGKIRAGEKGPDQWGIEGEGTFQNIIHM